MDLILANVEVDGRRPDVRVREGRIAEIGERLTGGEAIDGRGGALIPGLIDHHIHLLALAAHASSLSVAAARHPGDFRRLITERLAGRPKRQWLRVTGYHERLAGDLDRSALDGLAPHHPVRVQHQTGSLWILNSAALQIIGEGGEALERDPSGRATGRLWRGDAWLRARLPDSAPDLAPIGRDMAAAGVIGFTDASVTNDARAARVLAGAGLPQKLMLMSGGALPPSPSYRVGPCKVLLDEHHLPDFDDMLERIAAARAQGRTVAVHCVTAAELAFTLAAFESAGAMAGDRIEHGGVIPPEAVPQLKDLGLTVVTQPAFVAERGDRYLAEVEPADHDNLYRCASLLEAGVPVAGSSDAPYTAPDPWTAMRAAVTRRTAGGAVLGPGERLSAGAALDLYLGSFSQPAEVRRVEVGAPADLCLLRLPLQAALHELNRELVAATFVDGRPVYEPPG